MWIAYSVIIWWVTITTLGCRKSDTKINYDQLQISSFYTKIDIVESDPYTKELYLIYRDNKKVLIENIVQLDIIANFFSTKIHFMSKQIGNIYFI